MLDETVTVYTTGRVIVPKSYGDVSIYVLPTIYTVELPEVPILVHLLSSTLCTYRESTAAKAYTVVVALNSVPDGLPERASWLVLKNTLFMPSLGLIVTA